MARTRRSDRLDRGRDDLRELVDSVAPTVDATIHDLSERATPILEQGQEMAKKKRKQLQASLADLEASLADNLPEPVVERLPIESPRRKRRKLRTLLLVGGLGTAGVLVARKLMESRSTSGWQAAYTPPPSPTGDLPKSGPATDTNVPPTSSADDRGAASIGEALSDSDEHPHRDTTPEDPAYVEELDGSQRPGQPPSTERPGT